MHRPVAGGQALAFCDPRDVPDCRAHAALVPGGIAEDFVAIGSEQHGVTVQRRRA
jgi:hypothetical protein